MTFMACFALLAHINLIPFVLIVEAIHVVQIVNFRGHLTVHCGLRQFQEIGDKFQKINF